MTRWKKTISSIGALLLVIALLTSCSGPVPSVAPPPALSEKKEVTSEDLLLVDQLLLAGKYEDAVLQLQKLGQIDPTSSAVQDKLRTATAEWKFTEAQTLVAVGAYAEAIKKMKTALDVLPNDKRILMAMDEAYLDLGKKYLELLDVARAKEALLAVNYDQNLRLQAQGLMNLDVQAVENTQKGYQALQAGDYTVAMSYFKAALQLKPDLAQAQSGMKASETMIVARPTSSIPQTFVQPTYPAGYIPPSGTEPPVTTQPTESNSWEKPAGTGAGTNDWGQFKQWMENEINGNQMTGNAINENPLLNFENLAKIEDPQAYSYLAESDFANSLYLTAIKIYGERALYIASEIPRMFPLPNSLDPNYQTAQQRILRLRDSASFVNEGVAGLRAPTIFKTTQKNLQALIDNELAVLTSSSKAGLFAIPEVGQLPDQSQAYVDEFDLAQSKVLMVPFSQLPAWAQVKRFYIETSLNAYMLSEVAQDFERLLPLPRITSTSTIYTPAVTYYYPDRSITAQIKSSTSSPRVGSDLTLTLIAFNNPKSYAIDPFLDIFPATIRVALPKEIEVSDQGTATYRVEDDEKRIVWENTPLLPTTVSTAGVLLNPNGNSFQFQVRIEPDALNKELPFEVWIVGSAINSTPYVSSNGISFKLTSTKSVVTPGTNITYSCVFQNSSAYDSQYTLTFPLPINTVLINATPAITSIYQYGNQQILTWTDTISSGQSKKVEIEVQVNKTAQLGELVAYAQLFTSRFGSTLQTPNLLIKLSGEEIQEALASKTLTLKVGAGAEQDYRPVLDETIRLVRYSENLHWNLSTTHTPSVLDNVSMENIVRAANELSSVLYWIPIKWAQLSQLPYEYYVGYPAYSSGLADLPNAASLFDPVTGVVVKNPDSYLTISGDLTAQFGTPESWKDMIEFLRAQLLQRLAELGYR